MVSDEPVGEKVDKIIEEQVEEKVVETNLERMERLANRQGEMYNDIKNNRRRNTIGFFVIALLLSLGQYRQSQRTDDIQKSRRDNAKGTCVQDNRRIEDHNVLVAAGKAIQFEIDSIMILSTTVPEGVVLSPDQQERLDSLVKVWQEQKVLVDSAHKDSIVSDRDCSSEGIEEYLSKDKG